MASLAAPDDDSDVPVQTFHTHRDPHAALDAAQTYLEGAGTVAAPLKGRLERSGDEIMMHYGRVRTSISVATKGEGSEVRVSRVGRAPLEETRRWVFGLGLIGFALAWGLAWYNAEAADALSPLVTISLFFLGIVATVVGLYVIDLSLERRGASLCMALEDAMQGDPILVLQREVDGLERSSSIANGVIFYCVSLLIEFLVFVIVLGDQGIRANIDEAVTLDVMRAVFAIPIVPAVAFAVIWFFISNRLHQARMGLVERRSHESA